MNIDEKLEESIENKYMKDDKGKNKMELTIEESVYILKRKDFNTYVEDKAIETLLTAYEKEKEKNKELEKKNRELNIVRLEFLVSQFPDTTETYKKYKKELNDAIEALENKEE